SVEVKFVMKDGQKTKARQIVAHLKGPLRSLLIAERTALNIVQRCAGMATAAAHAVSLIEGVKGSKLKILDTRKTPPGMRGLAKQAVKDGGAHNHRFGLFDGVLIK